MEQLQRTIDNVIDLKKTWERAWTRSVDAKRAPLDADASRAERTVAVPQEASGCSYCSSPSIRRERERERNRGVCAQLEGIQEAKGHGRPDSHAAGDSYASRVSGVLVLYPGFKRHPQCSRQDIRSGEK